MTTGTAARATSLDGFHATPSAQRSDELVRAFFAAVNGDDYERIDAAAARSFLSYDLHGTRSRTGFKRYVSDLHQSFSGLRFEVHESTQVAEVQTSLIGDYNVSNLLAVIGGLRALGVSLADAAAACASFASAVNHGSTTFKHTLVFERVPGSFAKKSTQSVRATQFASTARLRSARAMSAGRPLIPSPHFSVSR